MTRHRFAGPVDLDALDAWNLDKALCASCELRPACHAENWDEPWMLAMRGVPVPRHHKGATDAA